MRTVTLAFAFAVLLAPASLAAQYAYPMAGPGTRVRVAVTATERPTPTARPRGLRNITGTLRTIHPDTILIEVSEAEPLVAVPRILIYHVERSLGRERAGSAYDAAMIGGGVGALTMGFFSEKVRFVVLGSGYALGGLVGAVRPFERWEEAYLPE